MKAQRNVAEFLAEHDMDADPAYRILARKQSLSGGERSKIGAAKPRQALRGSLLLGRSLP